MAGKLATSHFCMDVGMFFFTVVVRKVLKVIQRSIFMPFPARCHCLSCVAASFYFSESTL